MNEIHAAFSDCPLTLCSLQFGIPIYRCRLLSFFRLLVSILSFAPAFLSFCLSYSSIGLFLPNLPLFGTFFLLSFLSFSLSSYCLFMFCSLFPLWTLSSGRVSICCCSLRPRNLYLSGRKHRVRNLVLLGGYQGRNIDLMWIIQYNTIPGDSV